GTGAGPSRAPRLFWHDVLHERGEGGRPRPGARHGARARGPAAAGGSRGGARELLGGGARLVPAGLLASGRGTMSESDVAPKPSYRPLAGIGETNEAIDEVVASAQRT